MLTEAFLCTRWCEFVRPNVLEFLLINLTYHDLYCSYNRNSFIHSWFVPVSGLPLWLSIVLVGVIGTVYTSLVTQIRYETLLFNIPFLEINIYYGSVIYIVA